MNGNPRICTGSEDFSIEDDKLVTLPYLEQDELSNTCEMWGVVKWIDQRIDNGFSILLAIFLAPFSPIHLVPVPSPMFLIAGMRVSPICHTYHISIHFINISFLFNILFC